MVNRYYFSSYNDCDVKNAIKEFSEMNRIVILGAGESGAGAAVLAKAKGFDVFVSDFSLFVYCFVCDLQYTH